MHLLIFSELFRERAVKDTHGSSSRHGRYLKCLDEIALRIEAAEKEVIMKVRDHPQAKLLCSIPNIGYISALTIVAEIGDVRRFASAKKLMGYAGLTPSTYSSGDAVRHGRITRQDRCGLGPSSSKPPIGNPDRKNPGRSRYSTIVSIEKKGVKTAAVATAQKLCAVIWRMLTDNRPFEKFPPKRDSETLTRFGSSPQPR